LIINVLSLNEILEEQERLEDFCADDADVLDCDDLFLETSTWLEMSYNRFNQGVIFQNNSIDDD
jgi:hypothetical protein